MPRGAGGAGAAALSSPPHYPAPEAPSPQPVHRHSHYPPSSSARHARTSSASRRRSAPNSHHHLNQHLTSSPAAASPEVINSLVDSLSKLQPSALHNPHLYGSLAPPETEDAFPSDNGTVTDLEDSYLHPDDAASPPVVRTAKPPSGFSSHTRTDSETHSRRSSYHSGIGAAKGGVDIPSYVRNYMNRAAGPDTVERRSSRESSLSGGDKQGRLSYVSSRERIRLEKNRDNQERELRTSAAGILTATGGKDVDLSIPKRTSSYGKSSHSRAFPAAIVTNVAPMLASPIGSPSFAPPDLTEEYNSDDAAPPPNLSRSRPQKMYKRNSASIPKRTGSLPAPVEKLTPTKPPVNRTSAPHALSPPYNPPRPSFQSAAADDPPRPSSADSIDDQVDSYLCSPRLSQKIRMPNSTRTISFSEVGDPTGFAVFVCVGMGLTRYVTGFYDELALTLGLRLITPDRPGVGDSTPIPEAERTVLNWPDDVLYICQSLKITKFSVLAHSAGAIYALATALRMPGHIRGKIHLLAPWIPPSQMESVVKMGSVPTSQRILRALPTPILKVANSSFMAATSSSLTTSLPRTHAKRAKKRTAAATTPRPADYPDATNIAALSPPPDLGELEKERQQTYDDRLTANIWHLSTRNANPAVDLLVCLERERTVGFRYVDITREVVIHHGAKDARVPVENVRWLGVAMRRCEVRVLPTEGHGLMASASVMGGVLEEIAKEWRDWKKVVEGRRVDGGGRERVWAD